MRGRGKDRRKPRPAARPPAHAEEVLRASEERYGSVVAALAEGIGFGCRRSAAGVQCRRPAVKKAEEVLVTSYQQVDAETIKNVVLHPAHRMVSR